MRNATLAILGGTPVRTAPFLATNAIGEEEKRAVMEVLDSGNLSQFLGVWGRDFYGGPRVQALEREWETYFDVRHAVSVNSATSGLYAALGAAGVGPGDEVIVSPYTMSASAVGPLVYGATPVFADIDPRTYCLSPDSVRKVVSPHTKAIVVVDIFGHPADYDALHAIAREHNLIIIEDAAQAPGGRYKGRWTGTLGHMGVFSLNYHKTIHTGEGGIIVTDDDELAERLALIRNHGETVVKDKGCSHIADLVGFNYRMTEIEAAIAGAQIKKLESLIGPRIEAADFLRARWEKIPGLTPAVVEPDCRHAYYVFAVQYDSAIVGIPRAKFLEAVRAEGVPMSGGYVEPLYLQPIYQQRTMRCGPNCSRYQGHVSYERGICPTAELMHYDRLFFTTLLHPEMTRADLEDVATAVEKVALGARALP